MNGAQDNAFIMSGIGFHTEESAKHAQITDAHAIVNTTIYTHQTQSELEQEQSIAITPTCRTY